MAHAPGCEPERYVIPAPPEGFEWRRHGEVQVGDLDQFDRPVIAIRRNKSGTRVQIACGPSERHGATLPVEKMGRAEVDSRGLYRIRPDRSAEITDGARVRFIATGAPKREALTYVVDGQPFMDNDYAARTGNPPRAVVHLIVADDLGKAPSRQGRRTGYVDELYPLSP